MSGKNIKKLSDNSIKTLERLQSNYRFIYTVLMSAPLIVALENFTISTDKSSIVIKPLKYLNQFSFESVLIFLVFLSIQTRFYLGDLRYLDMKYLQAPNAKDYKKRYSSFSRAIDLFSLIIHAIFFYFLAASLFNFALFYKIFTLILFLNACWLLVVYLFIDNKNRERQENKATCIWIINNIIFTLILAAFYKLSNGLTADYSFGVFVVIALFNTIIDYTFTWRIYFPKLEETLVD